MRMKTFFDSDDNSYSDLKNEFDNYSDNVFNDDSVNDSDDH